MIRIRRELQPAELLIELRTADAAEYSLGQDVTVEVFEAGQKVDVVGTTKGKGFAGAMKRHGFSGLGASHGVSVSHRSHGSTGHCQDPGKVFKGKKMAGHMGDRRVTVHSLEVVATDAGRGIIMVKGAVPGAKGGLVLVFDAKKKPLPDGLPFPAAIRGAGAPDAAGEAPPDESPAADDAAADGAAEESPGGGVEQEEAKE